MYGCQGCARSAGADFFYCSRKKCGNFPWLCLILAQKKPASHNCRHINDYRRSRRGWVRQQIGIVFSKTNPFVNMGKMWDEVLNRKLFYSVPETKVIFENWRLEYNKHRPHRVLDYMTPDEFASSNIASASPTAQVIAAMDKVELKKWEKEK